MYKIRERISEIIKSNPTIFQITALVFIFVVAVTIRLHTLFSNPETFNMGLGPFGDTHLYHKIAYNLYSGNGFSGSDDRRAYGFEGKEEELAYEPTATRGPVYPTFMWAVYKTFGTVEHMDAEDWHYNWDKIRIVQCIIDALLCLVVYFIVRLIYSNSFGAALIAALLYSFSFYNVFYTRALLSESLMTFLLSLFILFCTLGLKKDKILFWIASGITFGLVILTKSEYILFPFVLFISILFINRNKLANKLKRSFIFIISVIIIVLPWTLRNYIAFKEFIPVSVGGIGYGLYLGTFESNENWTGWGKFPDKLFSSEEERTTVESLYESFNRYMIAGSIKVKDVDSVFVKLAIDRIRSHPLKCVRNWIKKIPRLWYQNYIPMYLYREASGGFFIFYLIFSIYAFWKSRSKERVLMLPICLLFIYLTIVFLPLHVEPRYGVALMPGIICLAGIGVWELIFTIRAYFFSFKSM